MTNTTQTVQLSSDLIRRVEPISLPHQSCSWCGGYRYRKGQKQQTLFRYGYLSPWLKEHFDTKLFCSKDCRDTYHS